MIALGFIHALPLQIWFIDRDRLEWRTRTCELYSTLKVTKFIWDKLKTSKSVKHQAQSSKKRYHDKVYQLRILSIAFMLSYGTIHQLITFANFYLYFIRARHDDGCNFFNTKIWKKNEMIRFTTTFSNFVQLYSHSKLCHFH